MQYWRRRRQILFKKNNTLKIVNLSINHIGDEGLSPLPANTSITELNLNYNKISCDGAKFVAKNKTLKKVSLSTNSILDRGVSI